MKQMKFAHKKFGVGASLALGVSALIVLAACGSSTAKVSPAAPPPATTSTTLHVASSAPVVLTTKTSTLGSILVDAKGMTLYTLTNAGKPVPCTGQCATFWPPLLLPSGMMTAMGAKGVTGLGTTSAASVLQVTEKGSPLYRFSKDSAPGDTNGEGISSFGGTWHVAKVANQTAATPPATASPVTTPPVTMPSGTMPPATMPPATSPPVTSPPATSPATPGGYY
jgi:predicted lipoprotein with Yx(FWY)xxD motif